MIYTIEHKIVNQECLFDHLSVKTDVKGIFIQVQMSPTC